MLSCLWQAGMMLSFVHALESVRRGRIGDCLTIRAVVLQLHRQTQGTTSARRPGRGKTVCYDRGQGTWAELKRWIG